MPFSRVRERRLRSVSMSLSRRPCSRRVGSREALAQRVGDGGHAKAEDVRQGRGHVDIITDDVVAGMNDYLIFLAGALPPRLLADDPDASAGAGSHLRGLLCDNELDAAHGLEAALEGLARLDVLVHGGVEHGLVGNDGIVRGLVEEGRLGKVEEYAVAVDALHRFGEMGMMPLDLVQRNVCRPHLAVE